MENGNFRMFPTLNRFNWWRNVWVSEEVTRRTLRRTYSPEFHPQDCKPVIKREIFAWRRNPFDAKLIADTTSSNSVTSLQTLLWKEGTKNLVPEFLMPCGTSYLSKTFSGRQPCQVVQIKSTFQTLNASPSRFSENCLGWERCQVVKINRRFSDRIRFHNRVPYIRNLTMKIQSVHGATQFCGSESFKIYTNEFVWMRFFYLRCYKQQTQIKLNVDREMRLAVSKIKPRFRKWACSTY